MAKGCCNRNPIFVQNVLRVPQSSAPEPVSDYIYAEGGVVTRDGNDVIHQWPNVGTYNFNIVRNNGGFTLWYLGAAGGGGGGATNNGGAGGGGGGGVLEDTAYTPSALGEWPLAVGAPGAGGISPGYTGTSGNNSILLGNTLIGGGGGGAGTGNDTRADGLSGGSAGGNGYRRPTKVATSTSGQGNDGGTVTTPAEGGSGGGGKSSVGVSTTAGADGGNGGDGLLSSITGTPIRYGAGGGGGAFRTLIGGTGGAGGFGGHGGYGTLLANYVPPTSGTDGTGCGGGGAGSTSGTLNGAAGSKGCAIIRYTNPDPVQSFTYTEVLPNGQVQWPWRDGLAVVKYNGRLLMLGGWNPGVGVFVPGPSTNEVWESWDDGANWTFLGYAPWTPRHGHGGVVKDGKIWVFGGDLTLGSAPKDMWNYEETIPGTYDNNDWTQLTADWGDVGGARIIFAYCVHGNEIYMAGGQSDAGSSMFTDIVKYNESTNQFVFAGNLPIADFATGILTSSGTRLWMYGGSQYNSGSPINLNNTLRYSDDNGANWTLHSTLPAALNGLTYCTGIYWQERLWFLNGGAGGNQAGLWSMNMTNGVWVKMYNTPLATHASSLCDAGNDLFKISGNVVNDVIKITVNNV